MAYLEWLGKCQKHRMDAHVMIGTSGWHYKHWIGTVYPKRLPAAQMLNFYQEHFDTVELNNTFYRLPPESAVEMWRESTPKNFRFAVKASRFLTHMKKLSDPRAGLARFFDRVDPLAKKLGPILFQLPPNFAVNIPRLGSFLSALPTEHRYAFEFRDPSWNHPEVMELLRESNVAYCIFELDGYESPLTITTDTAYVRLHGPKGKYVGSYDEPTLQLWAGRIDEWRQELRAIYVYFDNDEAGYAFSNALRLRELVRK
jgi:uncharacterized protein YecE (DUF72 family)